VLLYIGPKIGVKHYRERRAHNLLLSWLQVNRIKWIVAVGHILVISVLVETSLKKNMTMSLVANSLNCGLMLTVILCAVFVWREQVTAMLVVRSAMAFAGILCILLGRPDDQQPADAAPGKKLALSDYFVLVAMPITLACGNLVFGDLKRLDPILIPFFINLFIFLISLVICLGSADSFMPSALDFEVHPTWLFFVLVLPGQGLAMLLSWHFKVLAFKLDRVSRVAPIFFLESAIALMIEIAIYKVTFSLTQVVGLILVLSVFILSIFAACFNNQDD